ncbi:MAG: glycogen synthase GlgA [Candidatus Eisenbacteria bacterium]
MNVVYVSSEVVPFAKTGGLADVAGALPPALAARGHRVSVVMPFYRCVRDGGYPLTETERAVVVSMEDREETARIRTMPMEGAKRGAYFFVEHPRFFERGSGLYGTADGDYPDNDERFAFFSKAVAKWLAGQGEPVDIVHVNDWQSALLPIYLKLWYGGKPPLANVRSVLTIHNLAYQGLFDPRRYTITGLPYGLYKPHGGLEFWGRMNYLKGGILYADAITTVSRRYAEEIRTEEFGAGLDGVLRDREGAVFGIQNGIDPEVWNPAADELIPAIYSAQNLGGKANCKRALQEECGLERDPAIPLFAMISRLADQKGLDLLVGVLEKLKRRKFQLVLLGTGDEKYHQILGALAKSRKKRLSVNLRFDDRLAHRIEAGADIFLMPSRYEPSGLNQLYSLRYGTVPLVRAVGGLADTVTDCTEETLRTGTATGFRFDEYSVDAFAEAWLRALELFRDRKAWGRLMAAGMKQDWSWDRSAAEYEELYERVRARRGAPTS